jgi:hypothetical protein
MAQSRPKRKYRKTRDRTIPVYGARHDPPDIKRLSKALVALAAELAAAQAEADAKAIHGTKQHADDAGVSP